MRKFLGEGTLDDVIPRDYVHVFLIRDPVKTMPSYLQLGYNHVFQGTCCKGIT